MKKIIILLITLVLLTSIALAAQQGVHKPGTGLNNSDLRTGGQGSNQNNESNISQSEQQQLNTTAQIKKEEAQKLQNKEQVKSQIKKLKQEMEQKRQQFNSESQGSGEKKQQMLKTQNQVRVAAQTLSHMENMSGSRGKQISAIAKEFDNSIQATIKSEEKIQTRSGFARFFAGGDKKAAEELEGEVTQNQLRIQELKQLKNQTDCDEEVKILMQEQIQQMKQEQTRLTKISQKEKNSKGLFGWIWK
jgi:hypothetical protein